MIGNVIKSNLTISNSTQEMIDALKAGSLTQRDFYKLNLNGADLQKLNLAAANLIGANLSNTILVDADLSGADLRGANLTNANLEGAILTGACLSRAMIEGTNFTGANLAGVKLQLARYDRQTKWCDDDYKYKTSGAVGFGANLAGAFLCTANLRNADLAGVNLRGGYLSGADLTGANLQDAALSGADLHRAYLTGAMVDLRAANLSGVEFEHLGSIAGADFSLVQGLSDNARAMLKSRPPAELDVWNSFTRRTTRESLEVV
jgi:uncharacterized protein YjbI with pentapeptide repeats